MNTDLLHEYFKGRAANIRKLFFQARHRFDENSIHDLRVEIKKMRAFAKAVTYLCGNDAFEKSLKPMIKVFKRLGGIRDVQLQQQLVAPLEVEGKELLMMALNKEEIKRKKRARKKLRESDKLKIGKASIAITESLYAVQKLEGVDAYFRNLEFRIHFLFQQNSTDEDDWHLVRKLIKEYRFNGKALHFETHFLKQLPEDIEIKLGTWHDYAVAKDHIRLFDKKHKHEFVTALLAGIAHEKLEELRKNLVSQNVGN